MPGQSQHNENLSGGVAQSAEQVSLKRLVTGSNPVVPATSVKRLALAALTHICERCGAYPAERVPCRTAYADAKENESPMLCAPCAEEYNDYWDERWADYYNGSGVVYVSKESLKKLRELRVK